MAEKWRQLNYRDRMLFSKKGLIGSYGQKREITLIVANRGPRSRVVSHKSKMKIIESHLWLSMKTGVMESSIEEYGNMKIIRKNKNIV